MRYKVVGFVVWHGARVYLHRKYGDAPKRVAAAVVVAGGIGLAVFAQRQLAGGE